MIQAIVYTSNTGSTEQYARLLGQETGLPVCSLTEAKKTLKSGAQILYLGWIMASSIQGYADAARLYRMPMVCAVGMEPAGKEQELREKNGVPGDVALYPLQGGYSPDRLRGLQKLMMRMITSSTAKTLAAKADRTPEEDDLLDLMQHGGSRVSLEKLAAPIRWCRENLGGAQHE
ncbi:MAG: flavodoxin domain-containing protein [Candidatus Ventricola sp.]